MLVGWSVVLQINNTTPGRAAVNGNRRTECVLCAVSPAATALKGRKTLEERAFGALAMAPCIMHDIRAADL